MNVIDDRVDIPADAILGDDFLENYQCDIRYSSMQINILIDDKIVEIPLDAGPTKDILAIPPRSEVFRIFKLSHATQEIKSFETKRFHQEYLFPPLSYLPRILFSEL